MIFVSPRERQQSSTFACTLKKKTLAREVSVICVSPAYNLYQCKVSNFSSTLLFYSQSREPSKIITWPRYSFEVSLLFRGNFGAEMDSTKYENIVRYLRDGEYPTGSSKQEKSVLRRYTKKFTFNAESSNLFYLDKGQNGSTFMRLVIKEEEKLRVFQECHSSDFGGHAGRDNTIQKIKDRYYWPQYYNDTVEMVRKNKLLLYVTLARCIKI